MVKRLNVLLEARERGREKERRRENRRECTRKRERLIDKERPCVIECLTSTLFLLAL